MCGSVSRCSLRAEGRTATALWRAAEELPPLAPLTSASAVASDAVAEVCGLSLDESPSPARGVGGWQARGRTRGGHPFFHRSLAVSFRPTQAEREKSMKTSRSRFPDCEAASPAWLPSPRRPGAGTRGLLTPLGWLSHRSWNKTPHYSQPGCEDGDVAAAEMYLSAFSPSTPVLAEGGWVTALCH